VISEGTSESVGNGGTGTRMRLTIKEVDFRDTVKHTERSDQ